MNTSEQVIADILKLIATLDYEGKDKVFRAVRKATGREYYGRED